MVGLRRQWASSAEGPAEDAADITPHDTNVFEICKALWVGTGGNLKVKTQAGSTVTLKNVPSGYAVAVKAKQVFATGTTAADIVALY